MIFILMPAINPFSRVKPKKTFIYWFFWTISFIVAPVLFPLRVILTLLIMFVNRIFMKILVSDINIKRPLHPIRRYIIQKLMFWTARAFNLCSGYFVIKEINK